MYSDCVRHCVEANLVSLGGLIGYVCDDRECCIFTVLVQDRQIHFCLLMYPLDI